MSKVIDSLEKVLLPFAVKIGKQPHINAIKNGFIKLMPLTLAGAMFVLINNVFLSFGEGSFFYSMGIRLDASTIETLNGFKAIGGEVYNGTLGIMSPDGAVLYRLRAGGRAQSRPDGRGPAGGGGLHDRDPV